MLYIAAAIATLTATQKRRSWVDEERERDGRGRPLTVNSADRHSLYTQHNKHYTTQPQSIGNRQQTTGGRLPHTLTDERRGEGARGREQMRARRVNRDTQSRRERLPNATPRHTAQLRTAEHSSRAQRRRGQRRCRRRWWRNKRSGNRPMANGMQHRGRGGEKQRGKTVHSRAEGGGDTAPVSLRATASPPQERPPPPCHCPRWV